MFFWTCFRITVTFGRQCKLLIPQSRKWTHRIFLFNISGCKEVYQNLQASGINYLQLKCNGAEDIGNNLVSISGNHLKHTFLGQCRRDCCDMGQNDTIGKIELKPSIVLSSDNTNCKNDIQLFLQLFDELSVYRDYH